MDFGGFCRIGDDLGGFGPWRAPGTPPEGPWDAPREPLKGPWRAPGGPLEGLWRAPEGLLKRKYFFNLPGVYIYIYIYVHIVYIHNAPNINVHHRLRRLAWQDLNLANIAPHPLKINDISLTTLSPYGVTNPRGPFLFHFHLFFRYHFSNFSTYSTYSTFSFSPHIFIFLTFSTFSTFSHEKVDSVGSLLRKDLKSSELGQRSTEINNTRPTFCRKPSTSNKFCPGFHAFK